MYSFRHGTPNCCVQECKYLFWLKGLKPETFRDRIEQLNIQDIDPDKLTPEQLDKLAEHLIQKALAGKPEEARQASGGSDANDKIRQSEAMMSLDVSAPLEGSLARAASAVKAKALVVVSKYDHVVTPGPATEFARLMHAELLELTSGCGHLATSCEAQKLQKALAEFLEH